METLISKLRNINKVENIINILNIYWKIKAQETVTWQMQNRDVQRKKYIIFVHSRALFQKMLIFWINTNWQFFTNLKQWELKSLGPVNIPSLTLLNKHTHEHCI